MYHPPSDQFVAKMHRMYGELGQRWCANLPSHLDQLAQQWQLILGPTFDLSFNYVCQATHIVDGRAVVLKTGVPTPEFMGELTMHSHYAGRGAVHCLETDAEKYAVLLERVYPGTRLLDAVTDDTEATTIVANLIPQSLYPAADDLHIPTIYEWADDAFAHAINVCTTRGDLIDINHIYRAQAIFTDNPQTTPYLALHGDLHHGNILRDAHGWCIIDPQGVKGNAAYECTAFLRNPQPQLSQHTDCVGLTIKRINIMSDMLQIPAQEIAMWNYAAMVMSAWWCFQADKSIDAMELTLVDIFYQVWQHYQSR
jgi:streptomycin 6-kinase